MVLSAALLCLATNVYHEARGEPIEGQMAVALVTLNRSRESGESVCKVVLAPEQFSWTTQGVERRKGKPRLRSTYIPRQRSAWKTALMVAEAAYQAVDYTDGATHFHASYVRPRWASSLQYVGRWGNHLFYKRI